jgi:hypothetical protein
MHSELYYFWTYGAFLVPNFAAIATFHIAASIPLVVTG